MSLQFEEFSSPFDAKLQNLTAITDIKRVFVTLGLTLIVTLGAVARDVTIEVVDSVSRQPVPYVAAYITGTSRGELADGEGRLVLSLRDDKPSVIELSAMGYAKKQLNVHQSVIALTVPLSADGVALEEVVVKKKREHYSKRNNPAVDFMQKIRTAGPLTDPRRNPYYSYRKHERLSVGLNDLHLSDSSGSKFAFVKEHIDTSEITGKPVLPISVKEKLSEVIYRREPQSEKEIVSALRQGGVDEVADLQSMTTLLEDAFREIDLYDNDINVLQNRFVSPLSRIAPDFYKFYLTDTISDPATGDRLIELSFAPRNPASFGFIGRLYVEAGDTTMFVRRALMGVPPSINLNFIEKLQLEQRFDKAADGSRLKALDDFYIEIAVVKGTQGLYARRTTAYDDHSFDCPQNDELFDHLGHTLTDTRAYERDSAYWDSARIINMTRNERSIDQLMRRLRSVPLYYYAEKAVKILFGGYVATGNPSKFDFGPVNTLISGNSLEGARVRIGGLTTANLSPHWFARGYVAYGFGDRKLKYKGEVEYSFNAKRYHSREFPIHSLRLTHQYDVDQLGQHYLFTNPDNVFLALKRQKNELMTYLRQTKLEYTLELPNNFSIAASADWQRQEASHFVPFVLGDGRRLGHYDEMLFDIQLRYAPGEKFYQTKTTRIPVNLDPPVIVLSHTFAPAGFLGSRYTVNTTRLSVQKRFWFSAFGFADILVGAGHVWSQVPFPSLLTPNANLSYTIQPESYALLTPMEFMADTYAEWHVTYWLNGALFNNIPLIKKLKLREVVSFRGWAGELSDHNRPELHGNLPRFVEQARVTPMHWHPYMEISAGLDNIFKCLRVDYVWRLTYRNVPGRDRSGLRVALHVTF